MSNPQGVAVDAAGDVFIADYANNRVVKVSAGGTQTTIGAGLTKPGGVAVDAAGDVFVVEPVVGRVSELPTGGAQTQIASGLNSGPNGTMGVEVDVPPAHVVASSQFQLTATVQTFPAGGAPTGIVNFAEGSTSLGSASLSGGSPDTATP